ncbi:RES domain-containing protein [Paraburkholderia fungorum]|uniref:RES domain-containing protein n=1 Tax=Paraburkholderia fungorum TaxID=134537 RepID=A0A1H1JYU9_9BURK|nr:RES family NAD+ phosphorylase [Paraburkholderia fungorum]SDR55184.1 RES domain-containing protein [Paraburkholderia fungorum]
MGCSADQRRRRGGRVNRIGLNALYLALDVQTAVSEYEQISPLMPPGTLVSYRVTADPVVDFTGGFQGGVWSPVWEEFYCEWRGCWFNQRIEPPSWIIADEVVTAGAKGSLFRSRLSAEGVNLVMYVDDLTPADRIDVHDPQSSLPRDQSSWT